MRRLLAAGWTQAGLAERLSTTQQSVSRWANGEREPSGPARILIRNLAKEAGLLAEEKPEGGGDEEARAPGSVIPVMGYVGAGGDVEPDLEQVPAEGFDQIQLNARLPADNFIGLKVVGTSMVAREKRGFEPGDVVVVSRDGGDADSLINKTVVARTTDGHRFLKILRPGRRPKTYNLESVNAPAIENVRLAWVSEVWVVFSPDGWRSVRRPDRQPHDRAAGGRRKAEQ